MSEGESRSRGAAWRERFLSGTRGRLVTLLRRAARTSGELAEALQISPNAVRGHLASLERDGLVEVQGLRRQGVGMPPQLYVATAAAEELFPRAHEFVLAALLDALEERVGPEEMVSLLQAAGRSAGAEAGAGEDPVERCRILLRELGADVDVERSEEGIWFRGYACPLGTLVGHRPELCGMLAALLSEVTGAPVRDHCSRGDPRRPRCAFFVSDGGLARGG